MSTPDDGSSLIRGRWDALRRARDLLRRRPLILLVLFGAGFWFLFPGLRRETIALRFSGPPACAAAVRGTITEDDVILRQFELPLSTKDGFVEHTVQLPRGAYAVTASLLCEAQTTVIEGRPTPRTIVVDQSGAVMLPLEQHCPCAPETQRH
ncbi:MAG: hypothetical protein H6729_08885 [Deltaproteobacteria bacterium]|nr:hypothetical protein [Deltaproteobacteria bacterium]